MKRKIWKSIAALLLLLFLFPLPAVHAESSDGISPSSEFSGNITKKDNYYLDLEECKILDGGYKIINDLANVLFSVIKTFAYITCAIFGFAINFNLTDLLGETVTQVQEFLKTEVFDSLFLICFIGTGIMALKHFLSRNMIGVFSEIGKAVLIVIFAIALSKKGGTVLDGLNTITKQVSIKILQGMGSIEGTDTGEYANNTAEILWNTLVHVPWESLEFGSTGNGVDASLEERLLNKSPSSEERAQIVEANKSYFEKEKASERLGALISYFIPFIGKCIVYIAIVVIQIVFQALGILLMMIGMLVLVLSMLPGYELDFVWIWIKKLIENQMDIMIMTFIMGFIIIVDNLLYSMSSGSSLGWLGISMLQLAVMVGIVLCRKQVFDGLKTVQKSVRNPSYAKSKLMHMGTSLEYSQKAYQHASKYGQKTFNYAAEYGQHVYGNVSNFAKSSAGVMTEKYHDMKQRYSKQSEEVEIVDAEVVDNEKNGGRSEQRNRSKKISAPRLNLEDREQKMSNTATQTIVERPTLRLAQKENTIQKSNTNTIQRDNRSGTSETSHRKLTPNNIRSNMHDGINANGAKAEAEISKRGLYLTAPKINASNEDKSVKSNEKVNSGQETQNRKLELSKKYADGSDLKNFSQKSGSVPQIVVPTVASNNGKEEGKERPRLVKPKSTKRIVNKEKSNAAAEVASRKAAARR